MNPKHLLLLIGLTTAGVQAQSTPPTPALPVSSATPHLGISMKYNTEANRYEVYAQANFTSNRFMLGASQITIIVPKQVADQPLDIYSETARWTDYSSVYAPGVAPDADFHGISSLGKSIDFREGEPFMLFFFTLKGGYTDGVRLYTNGRDPSSAQSGMMGGDFANTLQDYQGKDFFLSAFSPLKLAQLTEKVAEPGAPSITVYPNPITGESFVITTANFNAGERVKLRLISAAGVELYSLDEDADKLVNYRLRVPRQLGGQAYLYGERTDAAPGQQTICKKLIISK